MAWLYLADIFEKRPARGNDISEHPGFPEGGKIENRGHVGVGKNSLDLRADQDSMTKAGEIERLDSESVTGQHELGTVQDGNGKHALQFFGKGLAIKLIKPGDEFRFKVGIGNYSNIVKFFPKFGVVVNFPV
ncbi:hypothetical protein BMS3Bbin14_00072 [bacterium BMS3Bbin14]|nr:hypothetical protein BMS3Bbin14_00072 [bacterium BMS3Bbin14]